MEEMMSMIMAENEMSTTTTTLPRDIIIDILSRLPANSLVTSFKLVCKAWCTLIKDPHFVKMHLDRGGGGGGAIHGGSNNNNNNSLICKSGKELFHLHPPFNFEDGLLLSPTASTTTIAAATKLDLDFGGSLSLRSRSRLVGSCNGLLCINTKNDKSIILLNPSTRRFKVSPIQPIERHRKFHQYGAVMYGFGCCYNSIDNIDEYKVIRIVSFMGRVNGVYSNRSQFDIYSMSSNSWRRVEDSRETGFRDYEFFTQPSVFSNGALHWVGADFYFFRTTSSWERIVSFVIGDEEFRKIPIPLSCEPTDDNLYSHLHDMILMNMRGCLTMIRFTNESNSIDVDLEIWVMKEYGIRESWTEEFVIRSSVSDPSRSLSDFVISCRSNAYVLKGDQILIEGRKDTFPSEGECRKLVLYGINERKIDGDFKGVPDDPNVYQVDYIETLVSLKS